MKNLLTIAGLALLAALATAAIGYLALELMPCSWFGGRAEGACGYEAVFAVMGAAPIVFLGLLAALCIWHARRRARQARTGL